MRQKMGILCSFSYLIVKLSGFETDGLQELVEGGDSAMQASCSAADKAITPVKSF
jgi:hypothetical protein